MKTFLRMLAVAAAACPLVGCEKPSDKSKVEVHAPGVDVKVDEGKTEVKAPGADVDVDADAKQ